jgi:hypothetical protein
MFRQYGPRSELVTINKPAFVLENKLSQDPKRVDINSPSFLKRQPDTKGAVFHHELLDVKFHNEVLMYTYMTSRRNAQRPSWLIFSEQELTEELGYYGPLPLMGGLGVVGEFAIEHLKANGGREYFIIVPANTLTAKQRAAVKWSYISCMDLV